MKRFVDSFSTMRLRPDYERLFHQFASNFISTFKRHVVLDTSHPEVES